MSIKFFSLASICCMLQVNCSSYASIVVCIPKSTQCENAVEVVYAICNCLAASRTPSLPTKWNLNSRDLTFLCSCSQALIETLLGERHVRVSESVSAAAPALVPAPALSLVRFVCPLSVPYISSCARWLLLVLLLLLLLLFYLAAQTQFI